MPHSKTSESFIKDFNFISVDPTIDPGSRKSIPRVGSAGRGLFSLAGFELTAEDLPRQFHWEHQENHDTGILNFNILTRRECRWIHPDSLKGRPIPRHLMPDDEPRSYRLRCLFCRWATPTTMRSVARRMAMWVGHSRLHEGICIPDSELSEEVVREIEEIYQKGFPAHGALTRRASNSQDAFPSQSSNSRGQKRSRAKIDTGAAGDVQAEDRRPQNVSLTPPPLPPPRRRQRRPALRAKRVPLKTVLSLRQRDLIHQREEQLDDRSGYEMDHADGALSRNHDGIELHFGQQAHHTFRPELPDLSYRELPSQAHSFLGPQDTYPSSVNADNQLEYIPHPEEHWVVTHHDQPVATAHNPYEPASEYHPPPSEQFARYDAPQPPCLTSGLSSASPLLMTPAVHERYSPQIEVRDGANFEQQAAPPQSSYGRSDYLHDTRYSDFSGYGTADHVNPGFEFHTQPDAQNAWMTDPNVGAYAHHNTSLPAHSQMPHSYSTGTATYARHTDPAFHVPPANTRGNWSQGSAGYQSTSDSMPPVQGPECASGSTSSVYGPIAGNTNDLTYHDGSFTPGPQFVPQPGPIMWERQATIAPYPVDSYGYEI